MRADDISLNMFCWGPSRRRAKIGDLFVYLMPDGKYRFLRFIKNDVPVFNRENLLYFYAQTFDSPDEPPRDSFIPPQLLIPPQISINLGWVRGYFKFVANWPILKGEVFPRHCFRYSTRKGIDYVDEEENQVEVPFEPLGYWQVSNYGAIDLMLSDALGLHHEFHDRQSG